MQDIYGGKVLGVPLPDGNYHCFNAVGDCVFDLTSEQFQGIPLNYTGCPEQHRGTHFAKEEKRQRYELLKQRLLTDDEQIDLVAKHLLEEYRPAFLKLAKQTEYDNLVKNLSAATFAPEIIQDLNSRLKTIKAEIEALETAEPPEEYSTNTILECLKAIKAAPDQRAVHLLIERVEVSSDQEKTGVNVVSTLTSVGDMVAAIRYRESSDYLDRGGFSGDTLAREAVGAYTNG